MKVKINEVSYGRNILKNQDFLLGEVTLITGLSGSGKTTALNQITEQIDCGYVGQDPDNQIVCDKVWHEMAFGLENIGTPRDIIRVRVAEVATIMDISSWFDKDVTELSGGQKQKLCLASILCTDPDIILLDEPTAMLDPISARKFISVVRDLHTDYGIRFVIVEHNTSYIDFADKVYNLSDGLFTEVDLTEKPILYNNRHRRTGFSVKNIRYSYKDKLILNIKELPIINGMNFIVGPNGVGKSTLLRYLSEHKFINTVLMPQDVKTMFLHDTVSKEFDNKVPDSIKHLKDVHPFDLSGGEQHIVGVLLTLQKEAEVYLFDEPTKGMDKHLSLDIMNLIRDSNKICIIVSHNLELTTMYSDNVVFLFNKEIAALGTAKQVFKNNLFYKPRNVVW